MHLHTLSVALILVGSLACKEPSAPAEPPDETPPPSEAAMSPESSPPGDRELTPTAGL